jgi:hypothetical protein
MAPSSSEQKSAQKNVETMTPSQQDIANLAYALWQQRGSPEGSPEADWTEAERRLFKGSEQPISSGRR